MQLCADLGSEYEATFSVLQNAASNSSRITYNNMHGYTWYGDEGLSERNPVGVTVPLETARNSAEDVVKAMGIDLTVAQVRYADLSSSFDFDADNIERQAYVFYFTREVNGIQSTYDTHDGTDVEAEDKYGNILPYERLTILSDDSGIIFFEYVSHSKVTEIKNDNVKIKSFEDIYEIFKDSFETKYVLTDNLEFKKVTYNITRIALGLSRVRIKDSTSEYMLLPVWDFFGTKETQSYDGTTYKDSFLDFSLLTINAVDGSVINRGLGY